MLVVLQQQLKQKYNTLYHRVVKAQQTGRFALYNATQKRALYQRLNRYENRLKNWGIAVASAAALFAAPIAAKGQITFTQQTGLNNPFEVFAPNNPLDGVDVGENSNPSFVDIDGDGDLDTFIGERFGTIKYFENTGSGSKPSFVEQTGSSNPFNGINVVDYSTPSFVDIDGDGDLDAFSGDRYGNINYYENTGSSSSPSFVARTGSSNPFNGVDVGYRSIPTFVDIDGDGDLDAFIGAYYGTINYYENTGSSSSPSFEEQTGSSNPFNSVDVGYNSSPSFVDIDGDGDLDAFIGEKYGTINYYQNTGSSSSPSFVERTGSSNPFDGVDVGRYSSPSFVDIDGDGDLDAFIGERYGNINYFENTGSGSIPSFKEQGAVNVGLYSSPSFADIDGDGDFDAFIGEIDGTIKYYQNTGSSSPSFVEQRGSSNPFNMVDVGRNSSPSFVDIDEDGDLDAFIGEQDGNINYYENTGSSSPSFVEQTGSSNPFNGVDVGDSSDPTFVDIDRDGDLDAFIGERYGTIKYYENTGSSSSPSFIEQTGSSNPFDGVDVGRRSTPSFVDIDGDGDFDAFIGKINGTINYYQNTGSSSSPSFSEQTGSSNPFDGVSVGENSSPTFVDIDEDGDMDAFIGEDDGNINYFRNDSPPRCIAEAGELGNSQDIATIELCQGTDSGVVVEQTGASANEEYTFLLVDGNGDIVANNTNGDFDLATLSVGSFTVYGLSYASINSPATVADYLADKTNITAIETDDAGTTFCLDLSSTATTGETNLITIKPNPVISQQPSNQAVCAGENASFEVVASGSNLSYQWQLDGADLSNENNPSLVFTSITTSDEGDYNVLITQNGCTISSDTVSLVANNASATIPDINSLVFNFCTRPFTASFDAVPNAVAYFGEVTVTIRQNQVITRLVPMSPVSGTFKIPRRIVGSVVTVRLAAVFIDPTTNQQVLGEFSCPKNFLVACDNSLIENRDETISWEMETMLSPNPTSESLTLSYESPSASQADIAIVDGTGKLVWQSKQASSEGDNQVTIAVADLPAGLYQLRLVIAEEVVVMPFVKQ